MKTRSLIIVFASLGTIWLLLMPLLVGLYLRGAVPAWTGDWPNAKTVAFSPGWFRSNLQWSSEDGIDLVLSARHAPIWRPGLLRLEGWLDSPATPRPARVEGHIGLRGGWKLVTHVPEVADPGSLALQAEGVVLNLSQMTGQGLKLDLSASGLGSAHAAEAGLSASRLQARLQRDRNDQRHLGLDLHLTDAELGQANLTLSAGPADPEAMSELIESLVQWAGSEPDSLNQRLAMLSALGAWQQLAAGGLVIQIEQLSLSDHTRISADWPTRQALPRFEGGGRGPELIAWSTSLGQLFGQPAEQTELFVEAWLMTLAQNGWIRLDGEHFELIEPGQPTR